VLRIAIFFFLENMWHFLIFNFLILFFAGAWRRWPVHGAHGSALVWGQSRVRNWMPVEPLGAACLSSEACSSRQKEELSGGCQADGAVEVLQEEVCERGRRWTPGQTLLK
jgi:hypothetical protein